MLTESYSTNTCSQCGGVKSVSRAAVREKQTRLINFILSFLPTANPYAMLYLSTDTDKEDNAYTDDEPQDWDGEMERMEVVNCMDVGKVTEVTLSSTDQDGGADLIAVEAVLDGAECKNALIDTGASASFVHRRWVEQHKNLRISKRRVPFRVTLADGSSTQIDEVVHVKQLTVSAESAPCDLIVMDKLR